MQTLIIDRARDLFFSYGLKSVSMDDIAKNAGVAKKTIYKDFEDKTALVQHLVANLLQGHREELEKCAREAMDPVDEVLRYNRTPFEIIARINQGFFYELEKFFPAVWKEVIKHRQQILVPAILENIQRGISEEIYRADIDPVFMADVRVQQIVTALNPKTFTDRKVQSTILMTQLSALYLQSIATAKGKKLINKYLNVNNEQQV